MTGAFLDIPGNLLVETAVPRPCRVVLGFRGLICCTLTHTFPQNLFQVGRGAGNIGSRYFPSRRFLPMDPWENKLLPTRSAQGRFSQQSPNDIFAPARIKPKKSMEKAGLVIPERKTKVFPPWPSSASKLESRNVLWSCAAP